MKTVLVYTLVTLGVTFAPVHSGGWGPSSSPRFRVERFLWGNGGGGSSIHPLDPLSESEVRTTTNVINNYRRGSWTFTSITLKEPLKSQLLPYFLNDSNPPRNSVTRRSIALLFDLGAKKAYEVTVNLDTRRVESWNEGPSYAVPLLLPEMMLTLERITKDNVTVQERCKQLGYPNMSLVNAEPWPVRYDGEIQAGKWVYPIYFFGKNFPEDNQNAHPFDFIAIVDLEKRQVIDIQDLPTHDDFNAANKEGVEVPRKTANYDPGLRDSSSYRRDLKPVRITQDGTSATLTGYELKWQKFKMRLGFNSREGLVIYNVNYNDNGTVRPLFYRMAMAEMFVPYGDPRPPYHWKYVLDEGEVHLGIAANTLNAQRDCLGQVSFIDGIVTNFKGEPVKITRAVCIREEDAGILWKHSDFRTGRSSIVRSQRLAMTFIATIGHYDYIYTWNFYLDGRVEFKVQLTGIPSANLLAINSTTAGHGTNVAPQINTQHHQHFFSVRIDPEIDGNKNSVALVDVVPGPGETGTASNPYGNGFTTEKTVLRTTSEGRTNIDPFKSRSWHIRNPGNTHPYTKEPVTWKLEPFASPSILMQKTSPMHPFAAWTDYNTWVTPYKEDQFYSAGNYLGPNTGLPEWVGENPEANIDNTDVVIWHTFGITHIVRVEDWPVMPEESCGVTLKPYSFFNENPSVDVPPPSSRRSEL